MNQYVIWLILLQLCSSEYLGYADYYPESFPLRNPRVMQSKNQSPDYNEFMKNLWQSPVSKERRNMPATDNESSDDDVRIEKHVRDHALNDENHIIISEDDKQRLKTNCLALIEVDQAGEARAASPEKSESDADDSQSDKTGLISKVKNKFLSLFSSRPSNQNHGNDKTDVSEWEQDELELSDNYDLPVREIFPRSAEVHQEELLKDLTETEVTYIKNFIKCFKESKKECDTPPVNVTAGTSAKSEEKPTITSGGSSKNVSTTTEICEVPTTPKSTVQSSTMSDGDQMSTPKTSDLGGKDKEEDTITVDLNINQQNGTGEEPETVGNDTCIQTPSHITPLTLNSNKYHPPMIDCKYFLKSKLLAHLHRKVDDVDKCSYTPVDLNAIHTVSDNNKRPTVIMGDGKTTECAPLRLNDMSFDLEWNKQNKPLEADPAKMNRFLLNQQGQSLATKFLQDANSYADKNEETPFLKQQKLPDVHDKSVKINSKRDVPFASSTLHRRKATKALPNVPSLPIDVDYDYEFPDKDSTKRRTRLRSKSRMRKKPKNKSKSRTSHKTRESNPDLLEDMETRNNYKSFDELNDIQFHVNSDDEEAIAKFIANLDSPPELFSFDVDKYLHSSATQDVPQTTRTYYEFGDAPIVDVKESTFIQNPAPEDDEESLAEKSYTFSSSLFGATVRGGPESKPYHTATDKKRDLLRQYIKGVYNALYPENHGQIVATNEADKSQKHSSTDEYVPNVKFNSKHAKPISEDDFPDNYYLLNDGSTQVFDSEKEEPDVGSNEDDSQKNLRTGSWTDLDEHFSGIDLQEDDKVEQIASRPEEKVVGVMLTGIGGNVERKNPELRDED